MEIALIVVLIFGAIRGYMKGLILSVASLLGLLGGIWAAANFSGLVAEQLAQSVSWSANAIHVTAMAITFVLVVVGVHFLAKLIEKVVELAALGLLNRLGGAAFGVLKLALLASAVMMLLNRSLGEGGWLPEGQETGVVWESVEALAPALAPALEDIDELKPIEEKVKEKVNEIERQVIEKALPLGSEGDQ